METSKEVLFFEKCRLCLINAGEHNVFDTAGLQRDIHTYTGVKVLVQDNLPHKICHDCNDVITQAKELRLIATKNDFYLRTLFDVKEDEVTNVGAEDELLTSTGIESQTTELPDKQSKKRSRDSSSEMEVVESKTLKVRTDLKKESRSSTVKVKTREDYKSIKKEILYNNKDVEFECNLCSKTYDSWKKLYCHGRSHNKNVACPLDACGKKFATNGDLERHLRTHTGCKPYTCDICEKSFAQQSTLRIHKEKVHHSFTF